MRTVDGAHRDTAIPAAVVAHLLCDQRVVIQTPLSTVSVAAMPRWVRRHRSIVRDLDRNQTRAWTSSRTGTSGLPGTWERPQRSTRGTPQIRQSDPRLTIPRYSPEEPST